jgi:hypothetical protein
LRICVSLGLGWFKSKPTKKSIDAGSPTDA